MRVDFPPRGSVVDGRDLAVLQELLNSEGRLSLGGWRDHFEEEFRKAVGTEYAMSVTSGTVSLELAIWLLDLAEGDEVIVTPQTFQASIQPLLNYPVKTVFCDVDSRSLNIDPDTLESLITDRTRAIILVHYGGYTCDMDRIMAIARKRGIIVIGDCAHTLVSIYHGKSPGGLSDISCYSFHTTKNITTLGEGGMLAFNRHDWAERIDRLRSNEIDGVFAPRTVSEEEPALLPWMMFSSDIYRRDCVKFRRAGTNATMSEAAAAVGLVQLQKLPELAARRRRIAERFNEVVRSFPHVRTHEAPRGIVHAYHLYTFFVEDEPHVRDHLVQELDRRGIGVQLRYFPLHLTPEWRMRGHRRGECPVAERMWFGQQVNLPCHPAMPDEHVGYLVDVLGECLEGSLCLTSMSSSSKAVSTS